MSAEQGTGGAAAADATVNMERIVSPGPPGGQPDQVLFRRWAAASPRAALIMVHGLGGHSDRFQECARRWAAGGITTYAPDLRGFGHTPGPAGHVDSFRLYHEDLEKLLARAVAENSQRPVYLLGESMGAVLAVDFVATRPALLSGLVLVSPSFRDRLGVPLARKAAAFLHVLLHHRKWYHLPWDPGSFTRDEAVIRFLEQDPLEVRRVTAQFYFAYARVVARARREAAFLHLPVLMLLPGEDRMIDTGYSRAYFERIPSPDKQLVEYAGFYHALLLELGRERVHRDIADWITARS